MSDMRRILSQATERRLQPRQSVRIGRFSACLGLDRKPDASVTVAERVELTLLKRQLPGIPCVVPDQLGNDAHLDSVFGVQRGAVTVPAAPVQLGRAGPEPRTRYRSVHASLQQV